jgi:hypothetical protein
MPVLAIRPADDEPIAAPVLDKATLDRRKIQRKILLHWDMAFHLLVDLYGYPIGDCASLNPNYKPTPNGRIRGADGPRLVGFKGPDRREESLGAWYCLDNGARGDSLFALVQYLSGCDFATATRFLKNLADRLCEVKSGPSLYGARTILNYYRL